MLVLHISEDNLSELYYLFFYCCSICATSVNFGSVYNLI